MPITPMRVQNRMRACKTAQERTRSQHHRNGHILRSLTPRRQPRPAVKQCRTPAPIRLRIARERSRKWGLAASASESGAKPTDARQRTSLVAALPAARARSIGNTQRRRRPRKGAQKRRNARRRGGRTFTHPPRAVRASRDLLPSPMNSAARARVRAGKYFLFLRYPALPASSPSPRHGVMHGVWRRECAHPRPTHTMRWASI